MGVFSSFPSSSLSWRFIALAFFLAGCQALSIPSRCATDACRTGRSVDGPTIRDAARPDHDVLLSRSYHLEGSTKTIVIVLAFVGTLAVCGSLATICWYRRGGSTFVPKNDNGFRMLADDKAPFSARYPAPPPQVYAERLASVAGSATLSSGLPSASSASTTNRVPNLVISIPGNVPPPPTRSWKLKRVPVPRLSRLPSAHPRSPLARIRSALRTPRRQDFKEPKELPRSSSIRPKAKPSPLPLFPMQDFRSHSPGISSGIPSALSSPISLASRSSTNRMQYTVY
ncbi:hypothetical protein C8R43DRAFT_687189 [Mycena crocata]|nr:hypothetical protein C8R43DRAFT_687189 [Mycena crocata]